MSQERRSLFVRKLWAGVLLLSINLSFAGVGAVLLSPDFAYAATATILSDSFGSETSNAVAGWSESETSGQDARIETSTPRPDSSTAGHVRLRDNAYIYRTISTVDRSGITLSYYWRGDSQAESTDYLKVYWRTLPSGTFQEIGTHPLNTSTSSWSSLVSITLPSDADDTSIEIKFLGDNSSPSEEARVDDVSVTGTVINTDPVAEAKSITTNEDTATSSVMVATDGNGDALTYIIVASPSNGTLSGFNSATGAFTYTPATNYNGPDSFTFKANDGTADSNVGTVSITINAINDTPSFTIGANQTVLEDAGTQTAASFITGISKGPADESGQILTFTVTNDNNSLFFGQPAISSGGTLTYTPAANENGSATVTVSLSDNGGGANTTGEQTFTITVNPVNDVPNTNDDAYSVDEDSVLTIEAPGVLENDTDTEDNSLAAVLVSSTINGTLSLDEDGGFVYTPNTDFHGTDSFTYKAKDTELGNVGTVTITVSSENDTPHAVADSYTTDEDTPLTIEAPGVLGNDTDTDVGDSLSAELVEVDDEPAHGEVELNSDGSFVYTPDADFSGEDMFTYTVNDGQVDSGEAVVTINVVSQNDAPVAADQTGEDEVSILEDTAITTITLSATDVDNTEFTFSTTSNPTHGTLGIIAGNQVTYTPAANYNGSDSFTFKANDGTADSNEATVEIDITPVNDAPTIELIGLSLVSVTVGNTYVEPGVTTNDVDGGDVLTSTTTGSVDTNTVGSYALVYEVSDGQLSASTTRTVNVTALPPADVCPNIEGMQETVPEGKELTDAGCVDVAPPGVPQVPVNPPGAVGVGFLGNFGAPAGLVLGASTSTSEDLPASCGALYLTDYLRMGAKNNPAQVILLQTFLNTNLNEHLPVTGFFGPLTHGAVKRFQTENADQILAPWTPYGLSKQTPTGYVYKTTKRWINLLECKNQDIPMPQLP